MGGCGDLVLRREMLIDLRFRVSVVLTSSRRFSGVCVTLVSRRVAERTSTSEHSHGAATPWAFVSTGLEARWHAGFARNGGGGWPRA